MSIPGFDAGGLAAAAPFLAGAIGLGYLLGSVPFGLLFTRWAGLGDIRGIGSGNIGATNVLRTGNRAVALATLVCDSGKGALAVLIADGTLPRLAGIEVPWGGPVMAVLAALASFAGHVFPVWLGFKGGKGVATFLGTMLALSWPVFLAASATWLATAAVFRISSLAALVAAGLTPVYLALSQDWLIAAAAAGLAALVFWTHRANIARLRAGTEPRIGERAKTAAKP